MYQKGKDKRYQLSDTMAHTRKNAHILIGMKAAEIQGEIHLCEEAKNVRIERKQSIYVSFSL